MHSAKKFQASSVQANHFWFCVFQSILQEVHISLERTVVWMFGELDYDKYFDREDPDVLRNSPAIHIAFFLLMIIVTVVFMNFMVSKLNVNYRFLSDIWKLPRRAQLLDMRDYN